MSQTNSGHDLIVSIGQILFAVSHLYVIVLS